jgi:putative methyltransferase (TIGR04325 family)
MQLMLPSTASDLLNMSRYPGLVRRAGRTAREMLLGAVKRFYGIRFTGSYSWTDAAARCGNGYAESSILSHSLACTRDLCSQERDVQIDMRSHRILAALLLADSSCVLDFGGSLGNHYFSVRRFLPGSVSWWTVELPQTAELGARVFGSDELHFASDLNSAPAPTTVLASSSLQYCSDPYAQLRALTETGASGLILDRLPLLPLLEDRLTIQTVPYYQARYPAWFFSEKKLLHSLECLGWTIRLRWRVPEDTLWLDGKSFQDSGLLAAR